MLYRERNLSLSFRLGNSNVDHLEHSLMVLNFPPVSGCGGRPKGVTKQGS